MFTAGRFMRLPNMSDLNAEKFVNYCFFSELDRRNMAVLVWFRTTPALRATPPRGEFFCFVVTPVRFPIFLLHGNVCICISGQLLFHASHE